MKSSFSQRSLISIADLQLNEIEQVIKKAEEFKKKHPQDLLKGKILASCFFEPSTRTRLSFETAMLKLGGQVIGFSEAGNISTQKGESLQDTVKVIGGFADVIVLRHPEEGSARLASESTTTPVINAGDGSNQHPTQTLLDLFTIKECQKKLAGLSIAFVGDLKYSRTIHSLCQACAHYDMRLYFVCPEELPLPEEILRALKRQGVKFSFHRSIEEVLGKADILYMTRMQKERFDPHIFEKVKNRYCVSLETLEGAKKNLRVLHPLPRVAEICTAVDTTPHAYYFQQAENGLYVRMALLALILK